MTKKSFKANGKLMLFGEYVVLRGVPCLAFPLRYGQTLDVLPISDDGILWEAFEIDNCWLEIRFSSELEILSTSDKEKAVKIQEILKLIKCLKPDIKLNHLSFVFHVDFDRKFGFGTSSTLISLLSDWSGIDPYLLLEKSFGGSGYDVAAAKEKQPFFYSVDNKVEGTWTMSDNIGNNLLFIYLGNKQKSSESVAKFNLQDITPKQIYFMNFILEKVLECSEIEEWEELMAKSEYMIGKILNEVPVKEQYFSDYPYEIKSMGAWGGDFIMATYRNLSEAKAYFSVKGYHVYYTMNELKY